MLLTYYFEKLGLSFCLFAIKNFKIILKMNFKKLVVKSDPSNLGKSSPHKFDSFCFRNNS
jgi:hypothetical protein